MTTDPQQAARERAAAVSARANRPSQRRCSEESGSPSRISARAHGVQVRGAGGDGPLQFEGLASVYERGYEMYDFFGPYTEVVSAGAAADSLARTDLDVPLVLQHQDLRRIARTTNGSLILTETDGGLHVNAPDLDPADLDVQYIVPKLRSGLIDEMSFKFRITSGIWSPDFTEYRIQSFDIHRGDVAIVGYGASPHTAGAGLGIRSLVGRAKASAKMSDADEAFLNDMIAHHGDALDMSEKFLKKSDAERTDPKVSDLARNIIEAQTSEIDLMKGWLDDAGKKPVSGMSGMNSASFGLAPKNGRDLIFHGETALRLL